MDVLALVLLDGPETDSGPSYEAETEAFLAAMSVAPDDTRKEAYDAFVVAMKAAGLWAKADVISLLAAHDAQAARLNLKNPGTGAGQVWSAVNSPTFTTDRGFAGDGATSYLDLGIGFASLSNYTLNDCCALIWSLTDSAGAVRDFGSASSVNAFIEGRSAGGNLNIRANQASANAAATPNSLGFFGYDRSGASALKAFKNGTALATHTTASSSLGTGNITIGRGNVTYSARQIAAAFIGAHLTDAEHSALYNAYAAWMSAVGAA